ncbi:MAG: class I SAM-dependent methyltransferase [Candidatus Binatia bacterium]
MEATANREGFDAERAQRFADRLLNGLNEAAVVLMVSIGHRTGLFDTLAAHDALTSEALAGAAGLNERYVREWLGAMASGGVIEYRAHDRTYRLPAEHAASLTRAAVPANLAATAQWIPVLAAVEDRVVECFKTGGGVPYAAYPNFHRVMADESEQTVLAALVDSILPIAPGLVERLRAGIDAVDVGCGAGRAVALLARAFPHSRFTGVDFSADAITAARAEAERLGLRNVTYDVADAASWEAPASFDLVMTFDAVHDQAAPRRVLRNIHRALRPGGVYLMQDIGVSSHLHENVGHPLAPFIYTISCLHCMTVSLAAGGEGLGAAWGEQQARELLAEAGFRQVAMHRLPHDIQNYYYVCEK